MNLKELDAYNLADAVKFHDSLNPAIWRNNQIRPEVKDKLLEIADDFKESLGINDLQLKDITVSGSNAGYTYTPHSDIDLHLVVEMPDTKHGDVYRELFNAKKYQYNDTHNIKIRGYDVELYVEDAKDQVKSAGIYSLINDDWIKIPLKQKANINDRVVRSKFEDLGHRIEAAIESKDLDHINQLLEKIKNMRRSGLETSGELGPENLVFKILRTQGLIDALRQAKTNAEDQQLSLKERKPTKFVYGYNTIDESPDGVNPTTCMFLNEDVPPDEEILKDFVVFCAKELKIKKLPQIKLKKDPQWPVIHTTFGRYIDDKDLLEVAWGKRHIMDVLRTVAHELTHRRQHEREDVPSSAGETGSPYENEANARAGILMRDYARLHPEYFSVGQADKLADIQTESASGYIPKNKREAAMPQYAMALSVDIKPGQTGREANKMALKTDRQGRPALLMKTVNLREGQEVATVTRIDSKPITDFASSLKAYKHTDDWSQSGVDTGDDSYWKNKNLKTNTSRGLFAGDPHRTALYATGNAHETRYVEYTENGQPVVYFDKKDLPAIRNRKTYLTVFDADNFKELPTGEWFSENPGKPIKQTPIGDPFKYIASQGWIVRITDDLNKVFKQVQKMHQAGKIAHYGAEGMSESKQGVAEATKYKGHGYGSTPLSQVPGEQEDDLGNQEATGPEFPPQMPAGTTKIDVSDLTDWYRLGMDISDLDDAQPEDYNQGPPQTVIVFPSDEAEQGYLKQFKRLGLKTHDMDPDVPGGEDIYGKHLKKKLARELREYKEQDLFEIKMSPTNLKAEAAKTGAMAGMEFEMIVPNVKGDPDDFESEPDYDHDERCRSIEDAAQFFYDGDFNGRRDIENLREQMQQDYLEWLDEKIEEEWDNDGEEYIQEWVAHNVDEDEWNPDGLEGSDRQEALEEFATNVHADPGSDYYQQARDEFREERQDGWDESDWLDAADLDRMIDIHRTYDITWPYYTEPGDEDDQLEINDVADEFTRAIGKPVNASSSYHGARREPGHYVVEPDGSLDPGDSDDAGLEFVSPPMPIDELLSDLNKVKAWADSKGCYTNSSTGLHINISVPNYDLAKLDYVKLALLLGDKYILDQYGRSSNTYAKSALGKVQDLIKRDPSKSKDLLDKMRGHMDDLATKAIHSGSTDKYTSINTKSGYIEFRSPGGDWLNANFDKIENTLMRFTVALSAAMNPEAYREEYLKKLYKLLEPVAVEQDKDTIKYFADYVAGKTPRAALRSFVKQAQLERKIKRGQTDGKTDYWWRVSNPQHSHGEIEVVARTKEEAIKKALGPDGYPSWVNTRQSIKAEPVRPFDTSAVKATVGEPQAIGRQSGPTLNGRPSNPDGGWVISPENDRSRVAYRFAAASLDDANIVRRQWAADNEGVWIVQRDPSRTLGQPQSARGTSEGNWGIWMRDANRFSRAPDQPDNSVLRRFPSREAAEQFIQQGRENNPNMRTDIEVREIEPTARGGFQFELSQTDIENRLGWPDQTGDANYEVINRPTMRSVFKFVANTDQDAARKYSQILQAMGMPEDTEDYGWRAVATPIPGSTIDLQRQRAAAAQQSGGGEFTGNWLILDPDGNELHRFSGIGNAQSDANRVAMQWLRQNPRHMQDGVEIAPEMRNVPRRGRELVGWSVRLPDGQEVAQILGSEYSQDDANSLAADYLRQQGMGVSGEGFTVEPVWREV